MTVEVMPDSDKLIAIYGAKCQECGHSQPEDNETLTPEFREKRRVRVAAEWKRTGIWEWHQLDWPKQLPAWLVREGFRCGVCGAPNLLLALTEPRP